MISPGDKETKAGDEDDDNHDEVSLPHFGRDSTTPHTAPISPKHDLVDRFLRLTDRPEEKERVVPVTVDLPGRLSDIMVELHQCSADTAVDCRITSDTVPECTAVMETSRAFDEAESMSVEDDDLAVDLTDPTAVGENNFVVDRTEPSDVEDDNLGVDPEDVHLGVDRTEATVVDDNFGVDQMETIAVNEDNLAVDQTELTAAEEDILDVDRREAVEENLTELTANENNLDAGQAQPTSVYDDNLGVDPTEPSYVEDNLVADRTNSTDFEEDNLGVDRTEPILSVHRTEPATVEEDNLAVDQKEPAGIEENVAVDQKEPAGIEENLAVDQKEPAGIEENLAVDEKEPTGIKDNLAVDQKEPAGIEENLAVDQKEPAGIEQNLAVDQKEPAGIEENLAVDEKEPAGIKDNLAVDQKEPAGIEDNLAVDQKEPAGIEDNLAVDLTKPAGIEENLAVDQKEPAGIEENVAVDEKEPAGIKDNLAVDQKEPAGIEDNLAVDLTKPAGIEDNLAVDQKEPAGIEDNLAVDLTKPAGIEENLAVDRKEPAGIKDNLAVDLTKPATVKEDNLGVAQTEPIGVKEDNFGVDLAKPAVVDDNLAVDLTKPAGIEDNLAVDLTKPAGVDDNLAVDLTKPATGEDNLAVDLTQPALGVDRIEPTIMKEKNVGVDNVESAAANDNAGVTQTESTASGDNVAVDPTVSITVDVSGCIAVGEPEALIVEDRDTESSSAEPASEGREVVSLPKSFNSGILAFVVDGRVLPEAGIVGAEKDTDENRQEDVDSEVGSNDSNADANQSEVTDGSNDGSLSEATTTDTTESNRAPLNELLDMPRSETAPRLRPRRVKNASPVYTCERCSPCLSYSRLYSLQLHQKLVHGVNCSDDDMPKEHLVCPICHGAPQFNDVFDLQCHMKWLHGIKNFSVASCAAAQGGVSHTIGTVGHGEDACVEGDIAELHEGLPDMVSAADDATLDVKDTPRCVSKNELQVMINAKEDVDAVGIVTMSHESHEGNPASGGEVADDTKEGKHDKSEDVVELDGVADSTPVADNRVDGKTDTAEQSKNYSPAKDEYCMRVTRTTDLPLRTRSGTVLAKSMKQRMSRLKLKHCVKTKRNTGDSHKIRPTGGLRTRSGAVLPERLPPSRVYAVNTEEPSVDVDQLAVDSSSPVKSDYLSSVKGDYSSSVKGDSSSSVKGDSLSSVKGDYSSSVKGDSSSSVKGDSSSSPVKLCVGSRRSARVSPRGGLRTLSGMLSPEITSPCSRAASLKTGVKSRTETRRLSNGDHGKHDKCSMKTPSRLSGIGLEPSVKASGGLRTRSGTVLPERLIPSRSVISKSEIPLPMASVAPNDVDLPQHVVRSSDGPGVAPAPGSIETKHPTVVPTSGECLHRMPRKGSDAAKNRISCESEESHLRDMTEVENKGDHSESVDLLSSSMSRVETSEEHRDNVDNLQNDALLNTPGIREIQTVVERGSSHANSIIPDAEQSGVNRNAPAQKRRSCSPTKKSDAHLEAAEMSHDLPDRLNSVISVRDIVEAAGEGRPMPVPLPSRPPRKILRVVHVTEAGVTDGEKLNQECISEMSDEVVSDKRCLTHEKKPSSHQTLRSAKRTCLRVQTLTPENQIDVALSLPGSCEQTESRYLDENVDALDCPSTTPFDDGVKVKDPEPCSIDEKPIGMNETGDLYIDLVGPFELVQETSVEDEWLTNNSSDNEKVHTSEVSERVDEPPPNMPHPVTGLVYECQLCGEQYTRRYHLVRHMSRFHKVKRTSWRRFCEDTETILVNEEPWRCTLCSKQFMMIREWRTHMTVTHSVQAPIQYDPSEVARSKPDVAVEIIRPTTDQSNAEPNRSGDSVDETTLKHLKEFSGERDVYSDKLLTVEKEWHVFNDDDHFGLLNTNPRSLENQWLKMNKTLPLRGTKRRPVPSSSLPWLSEEAQAKEKAQPNVCYGKRPKQASDVKQSFDDFSPCAESGDRVVVVSQPLRNPASSVDAFPSPTRQLVSHDSKQRHTRRVRSLHSVVQCHARSSKSRSVSQDGEQRNGQGDRVSSIEKRTVQSMSPRTSNRGSKPHARSYSGARAASATIDTKKSGVGNHSSKNARVDSQGERNARHSASSNSVAKHCAASHSRNRHSSGVTSCKINTPHGLHPQKGSVDSAPHHGSSRLRRSHDRSITSPDNSPTRTRRCSISELARAHHAVKSASSESRSEDLACKKTKQTRNLSSCVDSSESSQIHSHDDVPAGSSSSHSCKPHCRKLSKRCERSRIRESPHAVDTPDANVARRSKRSASEDVSHLRLSLEGVSSSLPSASCTSMAKSVRGNSYDGGNAINVSAPSTTPRPGSVETGKTTGVQGDARSIKSASIAGSRLSKRRRTLPDLFGVPLNSSYIT